MTRLIFLGTGAALPVANRTNTALAVLADEPSNGLLIDCGGDVYGSLLRAGVGPDAISEILITHAHIDHIGSLPALLESFRLGGRTLPLRIRALPEVVDVARRLIDVFSFELTLDRWTYDITFTPASDGEQLTLAGMPARVVAMDHTVPSVGVRLELPGGAAAYTSDTQPNPALLALGQGARMLISECTFLARHELDARSSRHMTAQEAGRQATACGVETLVLVHLGVADGWDAEEARAEAAEAFSGTILIPDDGQSIQV